MYFASSFLILEKKKGYFAINDKSLNHFKDLGAMMHLKMIHLYSEGG